MEENKNRNSTRDFWEWVIVLVIVAVVAVVITTVISAHGQRSHQCEAPVPEAGYWGCTELLNKVVLRNQNKVEYTVKVEKVTPETARITYEEKGVQLSFVVPDGTDVSYTLHIGPLFVQRHINKFYVRYYDSWQAITQNSYHSK